jgi:DIX domain
LGFCKYRYFIPEDGDSEQHLNVFLAPKSRNSSGVPTLGEIKNAFPLPGRYHFRFKSPLLPGGDREKNAVAVWMDCVDDRQSIPVWQNAIIAKVSRVGVEDDDDDDDDDEDDDFGVRTSSMPAQANIPHTSTSNHLQPPATNPNPMMDMFDAPLMTGSTSAGVSHNLLDVPNTSSGNETLLDMSIPHAANAANSSTPYGHAYPSHSAAPASSTDHDFFGMSTTAPPQTSSTPLPSSNAYGANNIPYPHTPAPNSGNNVNVYGGNYSQQQQGPFGGLGTPWNS